MFPIGGPPYHPPGLFAFGTGLGMLAWRMKCPVYNTARMMI